MNLPVVVSGTTEMPFHLYLDPELIDEPQIEMPFVTTSEFQSVADWFADSNEEPEREAIRLLWIAGAISVGCAVAAVVCALLAFAYVEWR